MSEQVEHEAKVDILPPEIPEEIWGIWCEELGFYCKSIDCAGDPMLMFFNEKDAEEARDYQQASYDIGPCLVVRIK